MKMPSLPAEAMARRCARHPWRTVGIWLIVVLLSLVSSAILLSDGLTSEVGFRNNPESKRADTLLEERLTGEKKAQEIVIVRSASRTVDAPAFRELVNDLHGRITALGPEVIEVALNYYQTGSEGMVSADRRTTIIPLTMAGTTDDAMDHIEQVKNIVKSFDSQGDFQVIITGDASVGDDWMTAAEKDLQIAELSGIPIALVILVFVFGALVAAFVPLIIATIAIVIAVGAVALIGQVSELAIFVTNMIVTMGLALGIDYSLFIISRYREERRHGREKTDAVAIASATAGRAVFFSGLTVVLALFGMLIVPSTIFASLAVGAILVVLAAILATLTLLPALLCLLGDRVNNLRIPFFQRGRGSQPQGNERGFWDTLARTVMRRPVLSLVLAVGLLVAAIVPISAFHLGASGVSSLPDNMDSKKGFRILEEDFSFGLLTPARIVIDGDIDSPSVQEGIARLTSTLQADPSFYGQPTLQVNPAGDLAELSAPVLGDPTDEEAIDAVKRLRRSYIPEAFRGVEATVLVTGATGGNIDYINMTSDYLPIVFVFVLGLSFVLLTIVFRSIVVPVKAILMNLLSVGAAYGLVVLVFQRGIGADLLGFQEIDKFEAWVPIFLFSVLFGLSMDYHVFLLTRVRERFDETGDNTESVACGLRLTGSIITGAALIMVAVFSGFAAGDLVMFQQMGFGMAVAVLLDATIVRSVVVPAAMRLLGARNWYLPKALRWLPEVRLRE